MAADAAGWNFRFATAAGEIPPLAGILVCVAVEKLRATSERPTFTLVGFWIPSGSLDTLHQSDFLESARRIIHNQGENFAPKIIPASRPVDRRGGQSAQPPASGIVRREDADFPIRLFLQRSGARVQWASALPLVDGNFSLHVTMSKRVDDRGPSGPNRSYAKYGSTAFLASSAIFAAGLVYLANSDHSAIFNVSARRKEDVSAPNTGPARPPVIATEAGTRLTQPPAAPPPPAAPKIAEISPITVRTPDVKLLETNLKMFHSTTAEQLASDPVIELVKNVKFQAESENIGEIVKNFPHEAMLSVNQMNDKNPYHYKQQPDLFNTPEKIAASILRALKPVLVNTESCESIKKYFLAYYNTPTSPIGRFCRAVDATSSEINSVK
ncbi:hypothetical protein [Magnetospirillum sp. UT-4]|uniref:hypothetical protein n=1 Tax=Magnetospirillum sp. UT-4 TaxID=2681467 RepID=UPI001574DF23|nr:hypothetical protein [Magnetospirillum sp. UT-4]